MCCGLWGPRFHSLLLPLPLGEDAALVPACSGQSWEVGRPEAAPPPPRPATALTCDSLTLSLPKFLFDLILNHGSLFLFFFVLLKRCLLYLNSKRQQETLGILALLTRIFWEPEKQQVPKPMN